ncbi:IgGFc-binding protein [Amia ocellicauda]|uniref:IgGFc-binding protein n=1 Tax=Amia ocellicauda TaxID=2972642 RepID=UPI003463A5C6
MPCRENCLCNQGLLLSGGTCVQQWRCGCLHDGYHQVGKSFYTAQCAQSCTCKLGGKVQCEASPCNGHEECRLENGVLGCYPHPRNGQCSLSGGVHLVSFDGHAFDLQGTCFYTLATYCPLEAEGGSLQPFSVRVRSNKSWQGSRILGDTVVEVEVGGRNYTLVTRLDGKIKVDGVLETLPFSDGQMHIYRQGVQVLVRTQSSVSIRFDLQYNLVVLVPEPYWALLCGLCGNFNGNPSDDLQLPDGQLARDTQALATSWKVPVHGLHCTDGCGDACPRCVPSVETKFSSDSYCGLIMASSGPFAACHPTVLPQPFFNNCVHDLCQAGGASGPFCGSLTAYTAACQEAGVNIQSWRSESLCPLTCSESGRYSLCVEPCLFVCDEVGSLLDCQSNCTEGCACREGYVFNGDSCIAVEECSCFKDGRRYEPGEERLLDNCTLSCTCSPPLIQCQPHTCSGSQTCFVLNGTMGCHSQDPCKEQCGPSQSCEWTEGKPVCVDQASGTCWTWGDPHYHTLDGWDFDFQGTCAYVLAATQPNAQGLEPFSVSQKNENHGNKLVSFVREVSVTVRGKTVSIIWQELGTVRVNGAIAYLPLTLLEGLVRVNQVGESVVLETDFGLRVMYDRGTTLLVSLAKVYRGKVNGLCGNFNGEPLDEMSVGTKISVEQWADKWRVNDGDQLCCTSCQGVWQTCGPNEEALYGHKLYCGALTQLFGPFAQCHDEVSPDPFFRGCKFDLCHHKGARQILCKALEAYVAVCWQKGIVVKDWRSAYRCLLSPQPYQSLPIYPSAISCPPHSHYNDCGTMCPPTCGVRGIATCVNVCVEGCFCDDGYQKSPLGCVNRCGCTYNGQYYQPGVSFWSPDNCLQHCVCNPRNGSVLCKDSRCTANQKCMLSGGIWGCYPIRFNCTIMGSLHFLAFDHRAFDFQGSCSYRLVGVCSQDPQLIPFEIHWGNNSCDACLHHCSSLSLEVYQMLLSIHKDSPRRVQVNGIHRTLPYKFQENKIMVYHSPSSVVMETDFGLQVVLHWSSTLTVFLPSTYSGVTCGLCGNANSDPIDDLLTPSGMLAQSVEEFGCSWKVAGVAECKSPCTSGPKQCTMEETQLFERGLYCGVLLNDMGPFAPCFQVVDPLPYFHNCINDACSYGGHFTALCSSIASYVAACQAAKVPVREWRRDTFCGAMCPENSKYELCGSGCPETCYKLSSPEHCSAPCQEGCQCDNGFALSDGQCVPILQCGCVYQGQYHAQGLFYPEGGCRLLCNCSEGGAVQCTQASCGSQERCALEEGVWQCVPVGYSTCLTLGATGYITFDGYSFVTQGVCSYILAQSREPGLATFSVLVRMEKAKNEAPQLREVVVLLEGSIVEIHYARLWNVRVNGEDFSLPWRPQGGEIWALQEGGYSSVILQTAFGLEIRFTSTRLLWLTVPSTYQNHLSGLCGNYNGLGSDDLVLPNGIRAPSVPAFVSSWTQAEEGQVCDGCDEDCPQCNTTQLDEHSGKLKCGMLTSVYGPFSTCRVLVDSQLYFKLCVAGLCITGGAHAVLCQALEAYSSACRSKGGKIGQWREHFSCSLSCPDVSSPSSCLGSCSLSCAEMMQPPVCGEGCVEGCQCDHGNLFSGKECVPIGNCGCVYNGRYIKMNEKLYNEDCTKWCWCHPLGGVLCEPVACGPDETCALRDGVRGCQASAKMCHLLQGSLLHSFYGMQMSLTPGSPYELSFLCDPTDDRWFRVVAYRGICGFSPGTTLHIFLGLVVIVTQNGIVKVNGRQVTLPLNVTPEIFLGQDGQKGIVVRRGSEVEVRLDFGSDTVTLQLSPWYAGKLCGACGNHNPSDDLNESVESWVAKKFPGCDING